MVYFILVLNSTGIIKLNQLSRSVQAEVHIRQVSPTSYLSVLNELKNKEIHNVLIDTNSAGISILLKNVSSTYAHYTVLYYNINSILFVLYQEQILQQQMNEYKYHYLFTSFDLETFDLEDFKYNFVNITAFRLVDMSDVAVKEILKDIESYDRHVLKRNSSIYHFKKSVSIEVMVMIYLRYFLYFMICLMCKSQYFNILRQKPH